MTSELKKLWNKRNELEKKQRQPTASLVFDLRQKRIRAIDKKINNFNKETDEYHWDEFFTRLQFGFGV